MPSFPEHFSKLRATSDLRETRAFPVLIPSMPPSLQTPDATPDAMPDAMNAKSARQDAMDATDAIPLAIYLSRQPNSPSPNPSASCRALVVQISVR